MRYCLLGLVLFCSPLFSDTPGRILIVSISGRSSCASQMNPNKTLLTPHISRQWNQLLTMGYDVDILNICFGNKLKVAWSWNGHEMVCSPAEVSYAEKCLVNFLNEYSSVPISVTSHSYGGYLALRLLLNSHARFGYHYLATLDPISFAVCDAESFFSMDGGCLRFPPDLSRKQIDQIADNSYMWTNIFQTKMERLHSGPAWRARNLEFFTKKKDAHDQLARDSWTLDFVLRDLTTALNHQD